MLAYQGKDGVLGQRLSLEALYGDLKNSTKKLMYVFLELEFVSSLGGILLDQFKIHFFFSVSLLLVAKPETYRNRHFSYIFECNLLQLKK